METKSNIVIYLLRRDLRVEDNEILDKLSKEEHGYTELLPLYILHPKQIEISGLIPKSSPEKSPYGPVKSQVGGFWRCGRHRVKFIAESVHCLKRNLESLGSGLSIRAGMPATVLDEVITGLHATGHRVGAVWTRLEPGRDEERDDRDIQAVCQRHEAEFQKFEPGKYFIDKSSLKFEFSELPDVCKDFINAHEPLRAQPRTILPKPVAATLPPFVEAPAQPGPFEIPDSCGDLVERLIAPLERFERLIEGMIKMPLKKAGEAWKKHQGPDEAVAVPELQEYTYPFEGGEDAAHRRLFRVFSSENRSLIVRYPKKEPDGRDGRNGLLGDNFSTRLSPYLAQGCMTARQIHNALLHYEEGTDPRLQEAAGYGEGENPGTIELRKELMWRDFFYYNYRRFRYKIFWLHGTKYERRQREQSGTGTVDSAAANGATDNEQNSAAHQNGISPAAGTNQIIPRQERLVWKTSREDRAIPGQDPRPELLQRHLHQFRSGTTGMSLIDASQRELWLTGFTPSRARENVASYLARTLEIDWRLGAEWYEYLLVDYDACSNWGNWQYKAAVGSDPKGQGRTPFNPIKQSLNYDKEARYIRAWMPEFARLHRRMHFFQPAFASPHELEAAGLSDHPAVKHIVKFVDYKEEQDGNGNGNGNGHGHGHANNGNDHFDNSNGYINNGYGYFNSSNSPLHGNGGSHGYGRQRGNGRQRGKGRQRGSSSSTHSPRPPWFQQTATTTNPQMPVVSNAHVQSWPTFQPGPPVSQTGSTIHHHSQSLDHGRWRFQPQQRQPLWLPLLQAPLLPPGWQPGNPQALVPVPQTIHIHREHPPLAQLLVQQDPHNNQHYGYDGNSIHHQNNGLASGSGFMPNNGYVPNYCPTQYRSPNQYQDANQCAQCYDEMEHHGQNGGYGQTGGYGQNGSDGHNLYSGLGGNCSPNASDNWSRRSTSSHLLSGGAPSWPYPQPEIPLVPLGCDEKDDLKTAKESTSKRRISKTWSNQRQSS